MMNTREVLEGLQVQGTTEAWRYSFDTAPVSGSAQGTPTMTVFDEANWADVTSAVTSGSASLTGTVIETPLIQTLTAGKVYRCVVQWSVGGSLVRSRYFRLQGEV